MQRHLFQRLLNLLLKKTTIIYTISALGALAGCFMMLGLVFYADDRLGATPQQIGWLTAGFPLFYALGCLLLRPITSRLQPCYSLLIATTFLTITTFIIAMLSSLYKVFFVYSIFGLAVVFFWPALIHWATSGLDGMQLSRAASKYTLSWSISSILGYGIAGWLSDISTTLPIIIAGVIYLTAFLLVLLTILKLPQYNTNTPAIAYAAQTTGAPMMPATRVLRLTGWLCVFFVFITTGMLNNIFPLIAINDIALQRSQIGLLLLTHRFSYAVFLGILGRLKFWHFRLLPMKATLVLVVAICGALILARNMWCIAVIMVAYGLVCALAYSISLFHSVVGEQNSKRRAARVSINESLVNAGSVAGSLLAGQIYGYFNATTTYISCAALVLIGIITQIRVTAHYKQKHGTI